MSIAPCALVAPFALAPSPGPAEVGLGGLLGPEPGMGWIAVGLASQIVLAIALLVSLPGGRGEPRRLSSLVGIVGLAAALGLLAYAVVRRDIVFCVGQVLSVLLFARIVTAARRDAHRRAVDQTRSFPVVAPDSAERRLESLREEP